MPVIKKKSEIRAVTQHVYVTYTHHLQFREDKQKQNKKKKEKKTIVSGGPSTRLAAARSPHWWNKQPDGEKTFEASWPSGRFPNLS